MFVRFLFVFDKLFILLRIVFWSSVGKEGLSARTVVYFMPPYSYVVGAGCGIRLYRFLIIAFSSTLESG